MLQLRYILIVREWHSDKLGSFTIRIFIEYCFRKFYWIFLIQYRCVTNILLSFIEFRPVFSFFSLLLLVLSCATWQANSIQGFKQSDALFLRSEDHFTMTGVRFQPLTINGSTIHLHLRNFDIYLTGEGKFSLDTTPMVNF